MVATPGNSLNITAAGLVKFDGTSVFSGVTTTQHDLLIGAASNGITSVAPSATSGVPVISQGASADPTFGTAVVAGGGTGLTSATAYAVLCGGTTSTGNFQSIAGVGTSGQVLTSNGAGALPTFQAAASGGNLVLIQSQTASTSASLTFTTGITATYANYFLLYSNVTLSAGVNLFLQISTNAGVSYIATGYTSGLTNNTYNSSTWTNGSATTGVILLNVSGLSSGFLYLFDVTGGANFQSAGITVANNGSGGGASFLSGGINTANVNAFKIVPASGTINTGTFTLFGILE